MTELEGTSLGKKVVKPAGKKEVVSHLIEHLRISERLACRLAGPSRTAYRYLASPGNDLGLRTRMKALAAEYPRYGYLLLLDPGHNA